MERKTTKKIMVMVFAAVIVMTMFAGVVVVQAAPVKGDEPAGNWNWWLKETHHDMCPSESRNVFTWGFFDHVPRSPGEKWSIKTKFSISAAPLPSWIEDVLWDTTHPSSAYEDTFYCRLAYFLVKKDAEVGSYWEDNINLKYRYYNPATNEYLPGPTDSEWYNGGTFKVSIKVIDIHKSKESFNFGTFNTNGGDRSDSVDLTNEANLPITIDDSSKSITGDISQFINLDDVKFDKTVIPVGETSRLTVTAKVPPNTPVKQYSGTLSFNYQIDPTNPPTTVTIPVSLGLTLEVIPEFATIAIPVVTTLLLVFLISRRRQKR